VKRTIKDFIFEKSLLFLALLTLAGLAGIVWFLFKEGMPVLDTISLKHFLTGHDWYPTEDPPSFGIFPLIIGSVSVTLLAAVMAIPLGILCAIYLSEIASSRLRSIFKPFIELLAAMPSVVIGFVGMTVLAPFLQDYFGAPTGLNVLNAAILLALMAVPTICTISEDALRSVPRSLKESSLALGATHWETLRHSPCRIFRNCNRSHAGFKPCHRGDYGGIDGSRRSRTHSRKPV
jgi:phosphate transport system permease protein